MPVIAAEAGVPLKIVYIAASIPKPASCMPCGTSASAGTIGPSRVVERPWSRRPLLGEDPELLLRGAAHQSRTVKDFAGTVVRIVRHVTVTEPAVTDLWHRTETEFRAVLGGFAERLDKLGALSDGITVRTATDILWTLNHPDTWYLLVHGCGWTTERYERWVGDTLTAQLLRTR